MNSTVKELKDRVEARRHEIAAKLARLKADTRAEAREQSTKLQHELAEAELHLKEGWDRMTDAARAQLSRWVDSKRD
jgi:hypothetical protein